ncbi:MULTISPECIES: PTS sugar transporter [unclassified Paenibacillus]|uniref:PTS sugar transporter n=1 Tax=unclassified Paenibacillus TaxID=185978 RepID=UPI001AE759FC|nr:MULTISPECIES: PTS sugar transporter [unclassified Paenibacillus]MBP1155696.1 fructose-specific phosphotransferase system IIC component [Paenibacillus sp. PvP091]MBP1168918.1 fructose-specific phosphotransferase system IIC component [Paenibacillus sp. PvR098]MBP2439946.1 fructose-specific phosphotransferase system IIC component [Paenibacillus sp. PvP052]
MKRIAILGSSGGNLFNLGGEDPEKLIGEIVAQCEGAGVEIKALQFIAATDSMDSTKEKTTASLYSWNSSGQRFYKMFDGSLSDTNKAAVELDGSIADLIKAGQIDALIVMSTDPEHANKQAILAAAEKRIPVVGTGGTSMALISSKGVNVIATSGTTGTTNRTRAVSFMTSLCRFWGIKYHPVLGETKAGLASISGNPLKRVNLKGIMQSSLPAFIAMAIVLALSQIPALKGLKEVFDLMIKALPVILAVIAAKQISDLDEVSIVAGVIAGTLSIEGGIIGGIIGGIGAGLLVQFLFIKCVQWRFPMTTVNIVAGGFAGLISGLIVYYLIAPIALQAGELIRFVIDQAVSFNPILAGIVAGLLIWPAILGGIYHAAILPIVLLEMENTGNSFLGAIDMVGLVMVSAGITLANIVAPRDKGEATVATPGFLINMGFGTFVEAAYPFMFSNKIVFMGAILSAGVGGGLVGLFNIRGTAYVPSFMGPLLSNNMAGFIISMATALILAFLITVVANKSSKKQNRHRDSEKPSVTV